MRIQWSKWATVGSDVSVIGTGQDSLQKLSMSQTRHGESILIEPTLLVTKSHGCGSVLFFLIVPPWVQVELYL